MSLKVFDTDITKLNLLQNYDFAKRQAMFYEIVKFKGTINIWNLK